MWFLPTAFSVAAAMLLNKILSFHAIHRHFCNCRHRTDTRRQMRFEKMTRYWTYMRNVSNPIGTQDAVTFDFVDKTIIVEIPAGSRWLCLDHCHQTDDMCIKAFTIFSGTWYYRHGYWGERPSPRRMERELVDSFDNFGKSLQGVDRDAVAQLEFFSGSDKPRQLQHQVCSAVQDADLYPELCSTPPLIRLGLAALRRWISGTTYFHVTQRLLLVQIRAILSGRDYLEYHGTFKGLRWFVYPSPPWAQRFEAWSQRVISKAVLRLNLWLGVWFLGMKGWYCEYEHVEGKEK